MDLAEERRPKIYEINEEDTALTEYKNRLFQGGFPEKKEYYKSNA